METLPILICKKCNNMFVSLGIETKSICPKCGSKVISNASELEKKYYHEKNK